MSKDTIMGVELDYGVTVDGAEDHRSLERRMAHLERNLAVHASFVARQADTLDEIKDRLNKPVNYPAWIASGFGVITMLGSLLFLAYIKPLQEDLKEIKEISIENRAYLRDVGDYTKETRGLLDGHLAVGDNRKG